VKRNKNKLFIESIIESREKKRKREAVSDPDESVMNSEGVNLYAFDDFVQK